MFNSILKTVCCLETRYPFCVWIFALYSKSYFFVCESVVFIYERYMRNDVQSYAFNSRKVRISSKSVVYLESYAFVRKKK